MAFQKFLNNRGKIGKMKVGEIIHLPEPYSAKLYSRVYQVQRRTGMVFEWDTCKTGGVLIRRAS